MNTLNEKFNKKDIVEILNCFNLNLNNNQTLFIVSTMEKMFDYSYETYIHLIKTYEIAGCMAKACHLNKYEEDILLLAALIHDIGKLKIDTSILHSKERLTAEKRAVINKHSQLGYNMIKNLLPEDVCQVVYHHHEMLNGKGYPQGLKDRELSELDKMLSVCDVTSSLLLQRAYKKPFNREKIIEILNECSSKRELDDRYVKLVIKCFVSVNF